MTRLAIISLALLLPACVSAQNMQDMAATGAEAADKALKASKWFMCKGASVGSVMRLYWITQAQADAWAELCVPEDEFVVPARPDAKPVLVAP